MTAETRIPPLGADDMSDEQRELLGALGGESALNIFKTLARHPGLLRRWLPFGGKLLQGGKLPAREREMIILRAAYLCSADYEWAQHVDMARGAGLSDDEIVRVASMSGWSSDDSVVLAAVDELLTSPSRRIGDATWAALAARFDEQQLIEVAMVAGHYAMLAGVLNSLGVQPEQTDHPRLGEA